MSLHSAGHVVQSVKLFAGNSITDNCRKDLVFVDFVGLCGNKTFKKTGSRRRVGGGVNSSNAQRNHFLGLAASKKSWASSIKSVLDLERVNIGSQQQSSDPKPKVGLTQTVCLCVCEPSRLIYSKYEDFMFLFTSLQLGTTQI